MAIANVVHVVPQAVLDDSRAFFQARGAEGYEGTALWVGRPVGSEVKIVRLFVPEQVAESDSYGARVDLTPRAHYTLTDQLASDERFYVRIHAHPREAYHSARDDDNAILTHEGALSVVVPYFARDPIELEGCAIYSYGRKNGWLRLSREAIRATFRVTP
jgi:hypothetical protein